jgi:hypothetical protein
MRAVGIVKVGESKQSIAGATFGGISLEFVRLSAGKKQYQVVLNQCKQSKVLLN